MLTETKREEVKSQIEKILDNTKIDLYNLLNDAETSGALTEEIKQEGNWLLACALMCVWCRKGVYEPNSPTTKAEIDNLSHFI